MENPGKIRILTGDRPTGRLHLGHYVGSLQNRLKYQREGAEVFVIIADYHTLTTKRSRQHIKAVQDNVRQLVLDYLAVGIDPKKTTIYLQSLVPEVAQFNLIFEMLVSVNRLRRIPTLKEKVSESGKESVGEASLGLLGYPVLQAADILMVKANLVPVGKDQKSHIELTREIARSFNRSYSDVFPEPSALLGNKFLPGIDGNPKMGKSLGNAIFLSDDSVTLRSKVMGMYTDPKRTHSNVPGQVTGNPVFEYHKAFNSDTAEVAHLAKRYRQGKVGDVEVKERLLHALENFIEPIRKKRSQLEKRPQQLDRVVVGGSKKASAAAAKTLSQMRAAMGLRSAS